MKELRLSYPDDLEAAAHLKPGEVGARIRLMAALKMFELGTLSSGKAAEFAELSHAEFLEACGRYNVSVFNYEDEDVEAELSSDIDTARETRS